MSPFIVCSSDCGESWTRKDQILTVGTKPAEPAWAGIGDFDVVWDWQEKRWFMLASKMRGAVSYDKSATAASWKYVLQETEMPPLHLFSF